MLILIFLSLKQTSWLNWQKPWGQFSWMNCMSQFVACLALSSIKECIFTKHLANLSARANPYEVARTQRVKTDTRSWCFSHPGLKLGFHKCREGNNWITGNRSASDNRQISQWVRLTTSGLYDIYFVHWNGNLFHHGNISLLMQRFTCWVQRNCITVVASVSGEKT